MKDYYARRANEYEDIYQKPERQADLRQLEAILRSAFAGMDVREVASGTGYWTQFIAKSARSILATDLNPEVLELAKQKDYGACRVSFVVADAFDLSEVSLVCNAVFHGFWWSHIPIEKLSNFLCVLHARIRPGAKVIMIDNRFVEGNSTPISRTDNAGNTYQMRRLKDGSHHEILKNFPSERMLREGLQGYGRNIHVHLLPYYWMVDYETTDKQVAAPDG